MPISMRIAFFIAVILLHVFIYFILFKNISASPMIKHLGKFIVFVNFFCIIIFLKLYHMQMNPILYTILSSTLGIFWISLSVAFLVFIIAMCIRFGFGYFTLYQLQPKILLIAWCVIGILVSLSFYLNAKKPSVVEQTIEIENLKQSLNVVLLTDLHIDVLMDKRKVAKLVQQSNELKPDIIILGGDIVDNYYPIVQESVKELGGLKAKYGTFYVLGNHEYYYDTYTILRALNNLGITTLINQNIVLRNLGINIAGVADLAGQRGTFKQSVLAPNIIKTLESSYERFPTIFISHQPKIIKYFNGENVSLVLSGHTHGGQIFPFHFLVMIEQPFLQGLHSFHHGNKDSQIYISKGAGWWGMPMRLFDTREISFLHLIPKQ
ncbi:metallophosphoesterase [Helicobacter didelphidarum]|uniref:Metallophosphoesterase n=1 Tax=Helicobacter didelphidarum TaxID=2040648 RepID=A0A3D8IPC0_9HELI|nr:metallophosphoesterase [Helicobacter didelphidarum]RDU67108.1 metallophosphoesterase [Helicobacter didelphidarum]